MYNVKRIELARKRRQKTAKTLADESGIAPVTLSRIINGRQIPDEDTVIKLARALDYPLDFFNLDDPDEINVNAASFRSLAGMTARTRDAALSAGSLAFEISDWVGKIFKLEDPNLIDLSHERDSANAARLIRQYWGIGEKPIGNIVHFLETKGVRVFSLSEHTKMVDAFSCWRNGEPFIFLNTFKTTERSRFDAAHELGHLILHKHGGPQQKVAEQEANTFASSFLMPKADLLSHVSYVNSLSDIVKLKKRWGVSAAALLFRLNKARIVSDWQYRTMIIQLNSNWSQSEPEGMPKEKSHVWKTILQELWRDGKTVGYIGDDLRIPASEVGALLFGLTAQEPPTEKRQGGLKVVSRPK
jgi:Zn-dependent peptidase ImmA (M78 family)/DNA-binding XRE family transcriptional regulator